MPIKSTILRGVLLFAVISFSSPLLFAQTGGPFDLTWNTFMDGGGGESTGGSFSVSGTIAQNDAGLESKTGSNFDHMSGFWVFDYTGTGEVYLRVYKSGNDAQLVWIPLPGVPIYDCYYATTPDQITFDPVPGGLGIAPPCYHLDALLDSEDYYYDVQPSP